MTFVDLCQWMGINIIFVILNRLSETRKSLNILTEEHLVLIIMQEGIFFKGNNLFLS